MYMLEAGGPGCKMINDLCTEILLAQRPTGWSPIDILFVPGQLGVEWHQFPECCGWVLWFTSNI